MVRACRPGGRVAIIDLVSPDDPTAASTYNHLERLRDPSHIRALTAEELLALMREVGLDVIRALPRDVAVHSERWMDLTQASAAARQTILAELTQDLRGLKTTGMRPFTRQNELMFLQTWLTVVGVK